MTCIVPKLNYRLRQLVFVAKRAQARRAQQKVLSRDRLQSQPSRSQLRAECARWKKSARCHQPRVFASPLYQHVRRSDPVTRRRDNRRETIASRGALRGFPPCVSLHTRHNSIQPGRRIISALIPKARQLASAPRALQRAGENLGETQSLQPFAEPACVALAPIGQGQIGKPGMLARKTPCSLAVPREINDR